MTQADPRVLTPEQLLEWVEDKTRILRLREGIDVLPGGYQAALAPALVSWSTSNVSGANGSEPFLIVRNVNCGGNPMEKTVVLLSARIPLDAVEHAEFTLVPSTRGGLLAPAHHAQLRFVFEQGREPRILNFSGPQSGADVNFPDLVLSWESWRHPGQSFSLRKGLDNASFSLSLRAYTGPQRFLEDHVRERDWYSYRLRLPGGRQGLAELLLVALTMGDGAARRTLSDILEQEEESWLQSAPACAGGPDELRDRWRALRERAEASPRPQDPVAELPEEAQSYHSLLRSCATLARYAICVAARRMVEQGLGEGFDPSAIPDPSLGQQELWMSEIAQTDLPGMFVWAPLALRFLLRHPESVPGNIPEDLDVAGLLEQRAGRPHLTRYAHNASGGRRPYFGR